jgi:Predicted membrane protein
MEHRYRSIVKAISWRATGTVDTFIVSYVVTGKVGIALSIGGIEVFTKMILYYFHERIWNRLNFGRKKTELEYNI